jgi:hypothetical protein
MVSMKRENRGGVGGVRLKKAWWAATQPEEWRLITFEQSTLRLGKMAVEVEESPW